MCYFVLYSCEKQKKSRIKGRRDKKISLTLNKASQFSMSRNNLLHLIHLEFINCVP